MGSINSFEEPLKNLESAVIFYLKECIRIINLHSNEIPKRILDNINSITNSLKSIYADLEKYQYQSDMNNQYAKRNDIINRINNIITEAYNNSTQYNQSILTLYSFLKTYDFQDAQKSLEVYKINFDNIVENFNAKTTESNVALLEVKNEYESTNTKIKTVLKDLEKVASKASVEKFAVIFQEQAFQHSRNSYRFWNLKKERFDKDGNKILNFWNFKRLGGAERWLIISILFITSLLYFLKYSFDNLPVIDNNLNLDFKNIIFKISILTILFFLIKFSIKQFSVNKHLYTINKHRENTLSSYRLFIDSMGSDDSELRNTLMLEVAKAIYENSKTGYISEKDGDVSSPSIIELTRMVGGNKN